MNLSKCQAPSLNHSPNLVTVWHGKPSPLLLCGYHSTYNLNETLKSISQECPNHQGAFDCSPFCELCGGSQELKECEDCFEMFSGELCACDKCRCHGHPKCPNEN